MPRNVQTAETTDSDSLAQAQYARRDWWGEEETDEPDDLEDGDSHVVGHDPDGNPVTKQKIESLAHSFLKQTLDRPMLDPIALFEAVEDGNHSEEGVALDLTDPKVYPPTGEGSQLDRRKMERTAPSTKRWRFQEETGHVAYGGIVPGRPADQLMRQLPIFFDLVAVDVSERNRSRMLEEADRLKRDGTLHDTQIIRRVARWIYNPAELRGRFK